MLVAEEKKESIWMRLDLWMHCLMAIVGGFMGAYAIFNRFDIFGSAVTGNLIHMVMDLEDAKMLVANGVVSVTECQKGLSVY